MNIIITFSSENLDDFEILYKLIAKYVTEDFLFDSPKYYDTPINYQRKIKNKLPYLTSKITIGYDYKKEIKEVFKLFPDEYYFIRYFLD